MKAYGVNMIKVWMLLLGLFATNAFATQFTHIKLNPQFERYLTGTKMKSAGTKSMALSTASAAEKSAAQEDAAMREYLRETLLGNNGDFTNPIPTDGEESLLYDEIRRNLESAHMEIGQREVHQLDMINSQFNLGSSNFSGFSWQKPFGVVHVYADRQVTPPLLTEQWLVTDKFVFEIEATTFLEKLVESGLSGMSATEIGAFAGITFKRVYTYYHFANSYNEGIRADFGKLFLSFARFNQNGITQMGNDEYMKREDLWTARAGGLITTPPLYNVSFSAGVLAEFDLEHTAWVQSHHTSEATAERYRIGVKSKQTRRVEASMELQLDFFKLIKFSLLRYDLSYEYVSGKEFTLSLSTPQWQHVRETPAENQELKNILKGFGQVKNLEPYVAELEEGQASSLQTRGSILIFGKLNKTNTEQVRIIRDQTVKLFYKNYALSVKVVQNFFSRIFAAVFYKVFKLPVGVVNAAMYNKQVTMEYEATHPQASTPNINRVESAEKFSFVLTQSYEAARTDRWLDKKFKNDLIWFVDVFTNLPKDYKAIIRDEQLKGPMRVESNLRVEKAGFSYLLNRPLNEVFGLVARVCESKRVNEWINEATRLPLLKKSLLGAEGCVKTIGSKFVAFKTDYESNSNNPSLAKFKDFLTKYYKKSQTLTDISDLFGPENTFIHGTLKGVSALGTNFETAFSTGQFRGLGVIDNYKRTLGSRSPASIVSE